MCLTIVEGPESLTKKFEIDMMGTRKSLKVTEALLFSFSQSTFYLNSICVFFIQKRKIEIQNRSKEDFRQKASSRGTETNQSLWLLS